MHELYKLEIVFTREGTIRKIYLHVYPYSHMCLKHITYTVKTVPEFFKYSIRLDFGKLDKMMLETLKEYTTCCCIVLGPHISYPELRQCPLSDQVKERMVHMQASVKLEDEKERIDRKSGRREA